MQEQVSRLVDITQHARYAADPPRPPAVTIKYKSEEKRGASPSGW